MHLIFVYGTLKRGCKNNRQMAGQKFVSTAHSGPGYTLHDLGDYPGLVADSNDQTGVSGEIWSVDDMALRRLDAFEGVHEGLYDRRPIALRPPHDTTEVGVYIYLGPTAGKPTIGPEWIE